MALQQGKKSTVQRPAPSEDVENLTAKLRNFVQEHKHGGALYPWEVGKQINEISNAYGTGSGKFSDFMENLNDIKQGGVGIPPQTGYEYLRRYRDAVDLFPEPVIHAMLSVNLLPNKQKVVDAARNSTEITNLLSGIRRMQPSEAAQWSPSIVSQIKQGATRIKRPKVSKEDALTNAICESFRYLLDQQDPLYKAPKKTPTTEQIIAARSTALRALREAISRLQLATVVSETSNQLTLQHDQLFDREI
jgi:hypothetical protein